jgi:hypothetical protein
MYCMCHALHELAHACVFPAPAHRPQLQQLSASEFSKLQSQVEAARGDAAAVSRELATLKVCHRVRVRVHVAGPL